MIRNILVIAFMLITYAAPAKSQPPIVVELFTSMICPACPPADRILLDLAQKENIIALGCHVSYLNSKSRKDTLSQEFCDIRQHGYVGLTKERRIYTPQMIVNGEHMFIGSNNKELGSALKSAENAPIQSIEIWVKDEGIIQFALPNSTYGSYRLWAFGYKNIKETAAYINPAISYTNLGAWQGGATTKSFEKPRQPIDGIIIIAQENGYEKIIAAGKLEFYSQSHIK